jgi:hypothetical protein
MKKLSDLRETDARRSNGTQQALLFISLLLAALLCPAPQQGRDLGSKASKQASFITCSFLDTSRARAWVREMEIKKCASFRIIAVCLIKTCFNIRRTGH